MSKELINYFNILNKQGTQFPQNIHNLLLSLYMFDICQTKNQSMLFDNKKAYYQTNTFDSKLSYYQNKRSLKSPTIIQRRGPRFQPRRRGYNH